MAFASGMNRSPAPDVNPQKTKPESGAESCFRGIFAGMDQNVNQSLNELEAMIRRQPKESLILAFVGGFFLCLLPLGKLVGILVKITFLLFKPALLILGFIKLFEYGRFACGSPE
jgi:hypothetical protein